MESEPLSSKIRIVLEGPESEAAVADVGSSIIRIGDTAFSSQIFVDHLS